MASKVIKLALLALVLCVASNVEGGKPSAPKRNSQGRRDANAVLLNFQNALAAGRWDEALAFCSPTVQQQALKWPNAQKFFEATMPIEHVLARDFGCWSCGDNFYGMFETLSYPGEEPRLDWFWGVSLTNGGWHIDYPPVVLADYVAQRKAALKERAERATTLSASLQKKAKFVSTRLVPLTDPFIIRQPMRFRLELTNGGPTSIQYRDSGTAHYGLEVRDARGAVLTNTAGPAQIGVMGRELPGHSSVVLVEALDITANHSIKEPGVYFVRFTGETLQIGEPVQLTTEIDRFGRSLPLDWGGLFTSSNAFPSAAVKIEVQR